MYWSLANTRANTSIGAWSDRQLQRSAQQCVKAAIHRHSLSQWPERGVLAARLFESVTRLLARRSLRRHLDAGYVAHSSAVAAWKAHLSATGVEMRDTSAESAMCDVSATLRLRAPATPWWCVLRRRVLRRPPSRTALCTKIVHPARLLLPTTLLALYLHARRSCILVSCLKSTCSRSVSKALAMFLPPLLLIRSGDILTCRSCSSWRIC